jgi:uncharacterized protein YdhG (YjbR/CyaY superfamily)
MPEKQTAKPRTTKASELWTPEEKAAMREAANERRRAAGRGKKTSKADGEKDVQAKIADMPKADRDIAKRLHVLIMETAPDLTPRTWYGFPAYEKDGKIVCHFQPAAKFKTRYATIGFSDKANLDQGEMWPVGFALTAMTPEIEAKIARLVKKAVR